MSKTLAIAALAATFGLAGAAMAQPASQGAATPPSTMPKSSAPTDPSATPPSTGTSSDTAATASAGSVSTGMSVKDNTGALIGEVSDVKAGVATIKMGADTFTVDTTKLAVADGSATINATQADIRGMLKKK